MFFHVFRNEIILITLHCFLKKDKIYSAVLNSFNLQRIQKFWNILTSNLKWKQLSSWIASESQNFGKNLRFTKTTIFILNYCLRYFGMPGFSGFIKTYWLYWRVLLSLLNANVKGQLKHTEVFTYLYLYLYWFNWIYLIPKG